MTIEQLTEDRTGEINDLRRFLSYINVLKVNVGLSDELTNELLLKINTRIQQCQISIDISIREYQCETDNNF